MRYSAEQLGKMKSETDWAKVDATTQKDVERMAEADEGALLEGWEQGIVLGVPSGPAVRRRI